MIVKHKLARDHGYGEIININENTITINFVGAGVTDYDRIITPLEIIQDNPNKEYLAAKKFFEDYRKKEVKSKLEDLLEEHLFEEAKDYCSENITYLDSDDLDEYISLENFYLKDYAAKMIDSVKLKLQSFFEQNLFKEAEQYCQENKEYIDSEWYNNNLILYKEEYVGNQKKKTRIKLQSLIKEFSFTEAEHYYQENKEYVDSNWYNNKLISVVNTELATLLNQLRQLQKTGMDRSLWDQDYPQRERDEDLIALVSKRILEFDKSFGQLPENMDLLAITQKNKLHSFHKCITELGNVFESEMEKEIASLDALNAPWKTFVHLQKITILPKPTLTQNDHKLISNWSLQNKRSTYNHKAMTSAREAEVAAVKLYCDIYGNAKDMSILQITSPKDDRWISADIETNGRWIDVKNARTSFSSKNSYSEHCVPQFKLDRNKQDVSISSFLSQYSDDSTQPITWLGETTFGEIQKLQNEFDSQYLQVTFSNHLKNSFLPAWLFDYPSVCYTDREVALAQIRSPEFIFPRQECDIGSGVLAKRVISSRTEGALGQEAMKLEQRIENCGLSRAVLFLHILDRFCRTSLDNNSFNSIEFGKILFPGRNNNIKTPLGVYDPLETVWNLWKMLVAVSENCLREARHFTIFRLRGANILQGRSHDGRWSTIFAYCGGWNQLKNVRCGQNPIYLGQDNPCQSCGRLICHSCGSCSSLCSDCKKRQDGWDLKIKDDGFAGARGGDDIPF